MKTISVVEAQKQLTDLIAGLEAGPVLLLRDGQPCAALVGLDERFDREAFSLGRNRRLRKMIDDACRRTSETGGVSFADILREIGQEPAPEARTRKPSVPAIQNPKSKTQNRK
jgi:antitoxin (DNA-binding transcriptional repressor) of toxin-antitoxin stability system